MSEAKRVSVVGDGWAALGAVGFLAQAGCKVTWITASGARWISPLPALEMGEGVAAWAALAERLGVQLGTLQTGSWVREFRNKSFREPHWTKAPTPADRAEVRNETLWAPETRMVGAFDARFSQLTAAEIEEQIRAAIAAGLPIERKIDEVPLKGVVAEGGEIRAVVLGSGEEIACDALVYADRWTLLPGIEGLPKPLAFLRNREPMGVLQAIFNHERPIGTHVQEGFFGALHKESGEEFERRAWGYFFAGGLRSIWTLVLAPNESEDNHEIGKKLRRLKQALEKMFGSPEWLPESCTEFAANVKSEQVRFEEGVIFAHGDPLIEPATHAKLKGAYFVTDGYGPSVAMSQVAQLARELAGAEIPKEISSLAASEIDAAPSEIAPEA